jgi:cytochrome c556
MIRSLLLATALVIGATSVMAQGDPIAQRKELLKSWGAATREPGLMLRGEAAFDLAKVQTALKLYSQHAKVLPTLFPDSSNTGGDTKALPVIWEKKAEFTAIFAKLDTDTTAALASIKDEASFKAEMGKVLGNCGACHNTYRAK